MVAWDTICKPKTFGGLGLRKSGVVNTVFLAKLGWKYLTQPDNFWVRQRAKYGPLEQFFSASSKSFHSWVWKCLLR